MFHERLSSNVRVDRAARFHSTFAAPRLMRNTLPPLRSNELLGGVAPGLRLRLGRRSRGRPRADPLPQRNDFAKVICVMYRHTVQFV